MKQIFYILLILCVLGLFGCSEQPEPKKTVVSIEVIDATVHLIDNEECSVEDLMKFVESRNTKNSNF